MKKLGILLALFVFTTNTFAQPANKAKTILDDISKKTKAYTSISAKFIYKLENKEQGINESQEGSILLKGKKYRIKVAGQELISDAKSVWTYLKDANEVQVNNYEENTKEGAISPSNIFTIYEKGFKYKWEKEEKEGTTVFDIITLIPDDPKDKQYHSIRLKVDKKLGQIMEIKVNGKDGNNYTYKVLDFKTNLAIEDAQFTFDKTKYPKVEVIDLR